jgi:hypothetical protein
MSRQMPEKDFQMALLHLYLNLDQYDSSPDSFFEGFSLSLSERQSLMELIDTDWSGLVVFNHQLERKRARVIRHSLPKSREFFVDRLEALISDFTFRPITEGALHSMDVLRAFSDFVAAQIESKTVVSRELEFIRFEAAYAALSLHSFPERQASQPGLRAREPSLGSGTTLIRCKIDVSPMMKVPSEPSIDRPCWLFLFRTHDGEVRVLKVAARLAKILGMLAGGQSFGDVVQTLASSREREAVSASIKRLMQIGVPFCLEDPNEDRCRRLTDRLSNG